MEITYSAVTQAANQVKSTANTIHSQLESLDARVKNVVSHWDGETREAFHARHQGWDASVKDMHQTLLQIATKLNEAVEGYGSNDRRQAARFGH
ncbi:WXG100 family type VII secretion target [Streptomyces sp. URMC 126]|uniref:WXG100 family type VII secretion target n=1 Tax=Streptomyces sp. URMC 126 TaxID=3423401 RepID=UPI003F1B794C